MVALIFTLASLILVVESTEVGKVENVFEYTGMSLVVQVSAYDDISNSMSFNGSVIRFGGSSLWYVEKYEWSWHIWAEAPELTMK